MILDSEVVEAVLAPIAEGIGVDGREDEGAAGELFRELRYQRKTMFRIEQRAAMGEDTADTESWDWETLGERTRDYLVEYAKDLEPMAMLIEASARTDGLAGLAVAMTTLADLVQKYWDAGLFPLEDEEDGIEARFQPLSGLSGGSGDRDGTLLQPLRRIVIARDGGAELRFLDKVTADATSAAAQSGAAAQRAERTQAAQESYDAADAIVRRVGRGPLQQAVDHLATAEAAWRQAISFISERTKPRFPAASRVSDELQAMHQWLLSLMRLLPDLPIELAPDEAGDDAAPGQTVAVAAKGGPMVIGQISERGDALRAVGAAADYFERYEPLSPIGATLREVDRRARLSLHELLAELIPDSSVRDTYYWRSGIKPPESAS